MNYMNGKPAFFAHFVSACLLVSGCSSTGAVRLAGQSPSTDKLSGQAISASGAGTFSAAKISAAVASAIASETPARVTPVISAESDPPMVGMIDEAPFRLASDKLPASANASFAMVHYFDESSSIEPLPTRVNNVGGADGLKTETSPPSSAPFAERVTSSSDEIRSAEAESNESDDLANLLTDETNKEEVVNTDDGEVAKDIPRLLPPPSFGEDLNAQSGLSLQTVVASVQSFFPLLEVAYLERDRTAGDQLAAWGNFDTKIKGRTENQPLGFYENYQHGAGVYQPLYKGGEVYGGYRMGRGSFEPWYLERETNKGGEFKTGFQMPLLKDHDIDTRRAELWRSTYDRQLAEPAIRQEVINTIRNATITYWIWVAAGQQYQIGEAALKLAQQRNQQIKRRVELGDLAEPSLADNQRAIIQRRGKLIDLERKLIQSAVKLSLFLRTDAALPYVATVQELSSFPGVLPYDAERVTDDINYAVMNRPELTALDTMVRRVQVDLAEAYNNTLPTLDAISNISQDVGERTSSKGDKSHFELEIGLEFEMPVQRRKGFGKMRSARAKINQLSAKRQFTVEKISTEVQNAAAGLEAAYKRVQAIADAVGISEQLAQIERRKFDLGESDLLAVFLREQIAIEAASDLMVAKLEYFVARADYTAALAYEFPVLFVANEQ